MSTPQDDHILIDYLERLGLDLTQSRELNVGLVFRALEDAQAAEVDLRALGFETAIEELPRPLLTRLFTKREWSLSGTIQSPTDTFAMAAHRRDLERIASTHGGEYDGWEVGVGDDTTVSEEGDTA